jgi:hypothetical protein
MPSSAGPRGRDVGGASVVGDNANAYTLVFSPGIKNVDAVPEPSTWAMVILGFCGLGWLAYRRNGSTQRFA